MADDYAGERYWTLVDGDVGDIPAAIGVQVIVRKIVLYPSGNTDAATIQEYSPAGALRTAMRIMGGAASAGPVSLDWGPTGRKLNGFKLSALSTSAVLDVYIGKD